MTRRVRPGRAAGAVLLAVCAVAACESDRGTVFEPVGDPIFDFLVAPGPARLPAGRADREVVRTLVRTVEVDSQPTGVVVDTLVRPSGNTQDTLAVDSAVVVMARALRALSGGAVYQVWAAAGAGTVAQGVGRVVEYFSVDTGELDPITQEPIFVVDSTSTPGGVYAGSDDALVDSVGFVVIPSDPGNPINPFTNAVNAMLVSIESGTGATAPSTATFLWRRVGLTSGGGTVQNATVDTTVQSTNTDPAIPDTLEITRRERRTLTGSGTLTIGTYGGLDLLSASSPNDYVFAPRGSGLGGARGAEISVDFIEIARPPLGFFYRGYVVNADGEGVVVDTLRSAWSADSSISGVSLFHADVDDLLPGVVGDEIRLGRVRNCATGAGIFGCQNSMALPGTDTFAGYVAFELKLEPKVNVAAGATKSVSHRGDLPDEVK